MKRHFTAVCALLLPGAAFAQQATVRVDFDAHAVLATQVAGLADPATGRRVTADDPVRIASVSKLVVALGVMRMVDAGTLSLDRDVSDYLGWRVRNPAYPDAPITLRMLLSHQSSLTDGVDYAIPLGGAIKDSLAQPAVWDGAHAPGNYFRYANINFPLIATIMERVSGTRFDALMQRLVFAPLKIDACFNWTTCSNATIARAVVLTDSKGVVRRDDLKGLRPGCPVVAATDGKCNLSAYVPGTNGALFSPQGGLRISANGLATIGQMLIGRGRGFLSRASFKMLVTPLWHFDGANGDSENGLWCRYGLAMQTSGVRSAGCNDDLFGDARVRIGHPGEAYGLRSGIWIDPRRKTGSAYFITAVDDDAPRGTSAFTRAEENLVRAK